MERKMNIAEFAALVGTTSKTIYGKINNISNLSVNEQLKTVKEKIKGRETTLILTTPEQIEYYQNLYGKDIVNEGEYYETLTGNNGYKQVDDPADRVRELIKEAMDIDLFGKLNTVYNEHTQELKSVYEELSTVKGKQLLLEDKANREGYYINEINQLKKENNRNKLYINLLITLLTILLLLITGFVTYNIAVNKGKEVPEKTSVTIEQSSVVQPTAKPVKKVVKKK